MSTPAASTIKLLAPPEDRRFPLILMGFIALSLLAHIATFFLFQVSSPPHVTIPPSQTQVSLMIGDHPEQQALLRWIESEDPALVAASAHPVPPHLFEIPYRPSYAIPRTAPRSMPLPPEPPVQAPAPELEALLRSVNPRPISSPAPVRPSQSHLLFSGLLASRAPVHPSPPLPRSPAPLEEASALLGVDATGEVRYAMLQRSSGDPATDNLALATLQRLHFAPAPTGAAELIWGVASINWGEDAYAPNASP